MSLLNLVAAEINLATFDSTLLPFCFIRLSNLCNVGHDMQYRGRNFTLRSLYVGNDILILSAAYYILYRTFVPLEYCYAYPFQFQDDVKLIEKMTNVSLVYHYLKSTGISPS